jgi:hypothetical protein
VATSKEFLRQGRHVGRLVLSLGGEIVHFHLNYEAAVVVVAVDFTINAIDGVVALLRGPPQH